MNFKIFFIAIITVAIACNDSGSKVEEAPMASKAQEDSLYAAVEEGHNVGMAKYGQLNRRIADVQRSLDSLNALPASKVDTVYRRQLNTLKEDLSYALMSMDKWMTEFKFDSAQDNLEVRVKYLESEKAKVTKVRDNILNSLKSADSLLKK